MKIYRKKNENKNKVKKDRRQLYRNIADSVCFLLLPAAFFYLLELYVHNPFTEVRPWAQFFNILLFELIAVILWLLTGSMRAALRIEAGAAFVFGIANAYVVRFRTNPIVPWDILSLRTAVSVADNYDFKPDGRMVAVTAAFLVIILLLQFMQLKIKRFAFWKRLIPAAAVCLILVLFSGTLQKESFQNSHRLYNKLFTPVYMTKVDGIPVTFVMNLAYMSIEKPEGYNRQEAEELLASYEEEADETKQKLPNLIVVMNESFSDLAVLGDFSTNEDYMPYLHSLQQGAQNTVTGLLNVSVCGGNTADSEFEFLTGNTMAFLPQGSIPYQQYINGEIPSLVNYLDELGYETVATHPYNASGWERDTVYPLLGFNRSIFLGQYRNPDYVRKYVSDADCVDKIIELYENKTQGKPLFVFNVTMQNHGGYSDQFDNFTPDITVDGIENVSLSQYLSLIKLSDAALQQLISYFSDVDEKTVVVFFGDHQPSDTVAAPILRMNGMVYNQLDEEQTKLRYQVPYVVWANFDIEEETGADTSLNYLAAEVLKRAGIPTSAYQNFLLEMKEKYPVLSAIRMTDAKGSELSLSGQKKETLNYMKLQYYQLFDWGN
jgi:phosphoglycerol transferase MdoB-like AlkP superfamily enzyme